MEITVKLYNRLREYAPDAKHIFSIRLPGDSTVYELLHRLKIPSNAQRTVLVNGRRVDEKTTLSPGDEVVMMSLIEGG